jgi:hypothetical protein
MAGIDSFLVYPKLTQLARSIAEKYQLGALHAADRRGR